MSTRLLKCATVGCYFWFEWAPKNRGDTPPLRHAKGCQPRPGWVQGECLSPQKARYGNVMDAVAEARRLRQMDIDARLAYPYECCCGAFHVGRAQIYRPQK